MLGQRSGATREGKIPDDVRFKTKPQLALAMLRRAVKAKLPRGTVLADEGYGSAEVREGCRKLGLDFAVAVSSMTRVWVVDALGRRHGDPVEARTLADRLAVDGAFRKYTWREGTAEPLHARFAFVRVVPVVPVADDGRDPRRRDRVWIVCEWRDGDDAPRHFHLATYKRMPFVQLVQLLQGALAHRARLPRSQGRAGYRSLRGTPLSWLAPPRLRRARLLRLPRRRTSKALPPRGASVRQETNDAIGVAA